MSAREGAVGPVSPLPVYGEQVARLLLRARQVLEPALEEIVRRYYEGLANDSGLAAVSGWLGGDDLERLRASSVEYLRWLLDPSLDRAAVVERGREFGRTYSLAGVEIDSVASAFARYQGEIFAFLGSSGGLEERHALQHVVGSRRAHHLEGVLRAYRDLEEQRTAVLLRVSEALERASTVADFARSVLEAMTELDGVVAGSFGRPDADGVFQFEVATGEGINVFWPGGPAAPVTTHAYAASGLGPGGRAWRTGSIQRTDDYVNDPTTAPWHAIGRRNGWRSSTVVPLTGANGEMRAMLTLYSSWPGHFAHSTRIALLHQLRSLVERTLARLEARQGPATHIVTYAERSTHLAKLEAGEVVMLYQPVVELATGRVAKLEALARLGTSDELVPPAGFLPSFGDNELFRLFEIGLDQALGALQRWEAEGFVTAVSLNLPASCGADHRYIAAVERALWCHGIAAGRLTLELLETEALDGDGDRHGSGFDELKRLGVRLAEDDLGSGYSSLLRLRKIDFDEVKIDQQLMRDAESAPRAALHFIQPLATLARSLGLVTSVEGLESEGLVEAAVVLGAQSGQGHAIARPLHAHAVPAWARTFRLDFDPEHPRTWLGAIAAHLVWENRLTALAWGAGPLGRMGYEHCALEAYIAGLDGDRTALVDAHEAVHEITVHTTSGPDYGDAWSTLEQLLVKTARTAR